MLMQLVVIRLRMKLVTQALKLQQCNPGFIDGRDAILKADELLYNGKYSCAIWKAFAGRGMGVKASQGSAYSNTDQVIDRSTPDKCHHHQKRGCAENRR